MMLLISTGRLLLGDWSAGFPGDEEERNTQLPK
jgi:hypothetical protein